MKPADTLTTLFRHNLWANLRLLEQCAGLSAEQLDATIPGSFGSIRETLEHIVTSEQAYYSRISTGQAHHRAEDPPPETVAEMLEWARPSEPLQAAWEPWCKKVNKSKSPPKRSCNSRCNNR